MYRAVLALTMMATGTTLIGACGQTSAPIMDCLQQIADLGAVAAGKQPGSVTMVPRNLRQYMRGATQPNPGAAGGIVSNSVQMAFAGCSTPSTCKVLVDPKTIANSASHSPGAHLFNQQNIEDCAPELVGFIGPIVIHELHHSKLLCGGTGVCSEIANSVAMANASCSLAASLLACVDKDPPGGDGVPDGPMPGQPDNPSYPLTPCEQLCGAAPNACKPPPKYGLGKPLNPSEVDGLVDGICARLKTARKVNNTPKRRADAIACFTSNTLPAGCPGIPQPPPGAGNPGFSGDYPIPTCSACP